MSFIVPANSGQIPTTFEMSQPFNIDAVGEVAYDTDPMIWARNHIVALLLTNPGERVMRPTYGAGVLNYVWENDDLLSEAQMISTIQRAVASWETNITLNTIDFIPQPDFSGIVVLDIAFSIGSSASNVVVSLGSGGVVSVQ